MAYTLEEDNSGDSYNIAGGIYGTWYLAQTFTASGSYALKKISIPLCRTGTPPTLYIELWSTADDEPDSMLKSKVVEGELSEYPSHDWVEVIFDTAYDVTEGTYYAIVLRSGGGGDLDNRGRWWFDSTGSWGGGELGWSNDGAETWNMYSSYDHLFKIYSELAVPGKPTIVSPSPTGVTNITLDETPLEWAAGDPAGDTYEIYFRESGDAWTKVGEAQAGVTWAITFGMLNYGTTYQWRIDATNEAGTTTGDTWSFTTIDFDQLRISYRLLPGGSGAGPYDDPPGTEGTDWSWTGENNMLAVRRLVVAANSKIWYEDI